jgi:hypothetical protein
LRFIHTRYSRFINCDEMRMMKRNEFATNSVEATHEMRIGLEVVMQDLNGDILMLREVVRSPYCTYIALSDKLSQFVFPQAAWRCAHASSSVAK